MKTITIRECALRACDIADSGAELLLAICNEAIKVEKVEWGRFPEYQRDMLKALYAAIAPDIIDSLAGDELQTEASPTIKGDLRNLEYLDMGGDE